MTVERVTLKATPIICGLIAVALLAAGTRQGADHRLLDAAVVMTALTWLTRTINTQ